MRYALRSEVAHSYTILSICSNNIPPRVKTIKYKAGTELAIDPPATEASPSGSVAWNTINDPGR